MTDLVSTAPGVYTALLALVQTAAAAQNPAVQVFPFELGTYEPGSYVTVHAIENQTWTPETLGTFSQLEHYDICGSATVFTGDSPATNANVATQTLAAAYSLFQACVMTPVMSNRTEPIFGVSNGPYQVLPAWSRYVAGLGVEGGPAGWFGMVQWGFHFDAYVTPA